MATFLALWVIFVWSGLAVSLVWLVLFAVVDMSAAAQAFRRWLQSWRKGGGRRG